MQGKHLARRLSDWVERGLVTAEQRDRILAYESARAGGKGRTSPWVLYGLLMLGGSVVGVGVVSLVAANWAAIPALAKVTGAFAVLIALAWAAGRAHLRGRLLAFDVLAALLSFGVLGTIALLAQVYHTGGELYMALGFWLVAIAPLAHLCRRGFLPHLWAAASVGTFVAWSLAGGWWKGTGIGSSEGDLWVLFPGTPLLCLAASNLALRRPSLATFARGYAAWSHVLALVAIGAIDVTWLLGGRVGLGAVAVSSLAIVGLLAAATLWLRDDLPGKGRVGAAALIAVGVVASVPLGLDAGDRVGHAAGEVIGAAFAVVALLLSAAVFAARGARRWFHSMTVLVGVRVVIVYLQVIGGLAATGLGLIVSGFVIIGAALLWFRTRARVEALFGGLLR